MPWPSFCMNNELIQSSIVQTVEDANSLHHSQAWKFEKSAEQAFTGGSTLHHVECNAFKSYKYSVFPNVCKTDYEGFNINIAPTSYSSQHDNEIVSECEVISSHSQCGLLSLSEFVEVWIDNKLNPKNMIYLAMGIMGSPMKYTTLAYSETQTFDGKVLEHSIMLGHQVFCTYGHMVIISRCRFIVGASHGRIEGAEIWYCWGYFQHCVGGYFIHLSVLMIIMFRIEFSYNHCCKCIWQERNFRSVIYIYRCFLIKYITSMGKYMFADNGRKHTEQPLQELLGQAYDEEALIANGIGVNWIVAEAILTKYGFRFYTGWTIYNIYEHHLEKQLVGNFRIRMLSGSCHFPEGRFPGVRKNVVIILESFVWDPSLGVIFFSLPSHMLCWCAFGEHSVFCTSLGQGGGGKEDGYA